MSETLDVKVPDIGDFQGVPVIEVIVKPGDHVEKDQGLVTLESAKATMEVPSPLAGTVRDVKVKVNDEVSEGDVIATIEAEEAGGGDGESAEAKGGGEAESRQNDEGEKPAKPGAGKAPPAPPAAEQAAPPEKQTPPAAHPREEGPQAKQEAPAASDTSAAARRSGENAGAPRTPPIPFDAESVMPGKVPYASPVVRAFARELGVDLAQVAGSERGGRITREDVQKFVKSAMAGGARPGTATGGGLNLPPWPKVDFSKYGEIETRPLTRIQKLSGPNLARNWVMIPHVTQFEDADITNLEALRVALNQEHQKEGVKVTLLAFLIRASVAALQKYPNFNASLDGSGENLVMKRHFHIGFAADTPNGLVVPVIRDCDSKGVLGIAQEMSALAKKAREGKLTPGEMSGGCFSISSLGGIGGTAFTPIINAPEVAILGVSKSSMKPVWNGNEFAPRLILPLSLSYDHRVIDGADGARFLRWVIDALEQPFLLALQG
ncbi:MAG: dihydrolipoyllysine-residue acetyltransferase [Rhodanobacteraceae bacterium]